MVQIIAFLNMLLEDALYIDTSPTQVMVHIPDTVFPSWEIDAR